MTVQHELSAQARNFNWLLTSFVEGTSGVTLSVAVSSDGLLMAMSNSIDRATADEILSLLQQLNRQHKKTIVMVTHDPKAADHATRQPPQCSSNGAACRAWTTASSVRPSAMRVRAAPTIAVARAAGQVPNVRGRDRDASR